MEHKTTQPNKIEPSTLVLPMFLPWSADGLSPPNYKEDLSGFGSHDMGRYLTEAQTGNIPLITGSPTPIFNLDLFEESARKPKI